MEAGDDPRSCFVVTGAAPPRSDQDLICSAVLAGVALLLSHRDHEPSCDAQGRRAISVPLTPVKTGISRSLADSQLRSSGHVKALEGPDSQADSMRVSAMYAHRAKRVGYGHRES